MAKVAISGGGLVPGILEKLPSQLVKHVYFVQLTKWRLSSHQAQGPCLYCAWFSGWCKTQTSVSLLRSWVNTAEHSHAGGAPSLSLSTPPLASAHATSFRNARLSAGVCRAGFPSWDEDVGNVIKEKKNSRIEIYPLVTQVELWFRFFPPNNFQKSLKKKKKPWGSPQRQQCSEWSCLGWRCWYPKRSSESTSRNRS